MSKEFEDYAAFRDPPGFVYLIRCGDTSYYKIGRATDISARLSALQAGCPFDLNYAFWAEVERPKKIEFDLHKCFVGSRGIREWFLLKQSDIDFIVKRLKEKSHYYKQSNDSV